MIPVPQMKEVCGSREGSECHLPCRGVQDAALQHLCVQAGTLWPRCQAGWGRLANR